MLSVENLATLNQQQSSGNTPRAYKQSNNKPSATHEQPNHHQTTGNITITYQQPNNLPTTHQQPTNKAPTKHQQPTDNSSTMNLPTTQFMVQLLQFYRRHRPPEGPQKQLRSKYNAVPQKKCHAIVLIIVIVIVIVITYQNILSKRLDFSTPCLELQI